MSNIKDSNIKDKELNINTKGKDNIYINNTNENEDSINTNISNNNDNSIVNNNIYNNKSQEVEEKKVPPQLSKYIFGHGELAAKPGRKKEPPAFKELAKNYSTIALRRVIQVLLNPDEDTKNVLKAAEMIIDRGVGKPIQEIISENRNENINTNISNLSDSEKNQRILELLKSISKTQEKEQTFVIEKENEKSENVTQ